MPRETIRLLIADDELLARRLVREYVARIPGVEVVAECADTAALEAALAASSSIDAALLDIRMPGRDIFEVLADAAVRASIPPLIFATAYDRYAVRAFEVNAVDYLVKPFSEARLADAFARLPTRTGPAGTATNVSSLLRDLGRAPDRLLVPDGTRIVPLPVTAILWIQAEGDYARLHAAGKSYLVYRTLADLERRLDPTAFLRVHRPSCAWTRSRRCGR